MADDLRSPPNCVCTWAPEGEMGESGYVPTPDPACPQHGTEAELRDRLAWHEATYGRISELVGFDPAEPFPAVELNEAIQAALAAAEHRGREQQRAADEPVIEAAKAWRNECAEYERVALTNTVKDVIAARKRLFAAVDALVASPEGPETP
jgi:hypothetical protein